MRRIKLLLPATILTAAAAHATAPDSDFANAMNVAMDRMMVGMDVAPTDDVDRDFAVMMIPHHQGAIDMAVAELRYGKDPQLKRIAQEIIVDQQREIAATRLAIEEPLPPSAPAPTQPTPARMPWAPIRHSAGDAAGALFPWAGGARPRGPSGGTLGRRPPAGKLR